MSSKLTSKQFIAKSINKHGDKYDYSLVKYVSSAAKVKLICQKHGIFEQVAGTHMRGAGCKKCANESSRLMKREDLIAQFLNVHGDKYDYSKMNYSGNNCNITIICKTHGEFEQHPAIHKKGANCPQCAIITKKHTTLTTEQFINKSNEVHNNLYDYSLTDYTVSHDKVKIICKTHGMFEQLANTHLNGSGCQQCANEIRNIGNTLTTEQFMAKANSIHNDTYDYNNSIYKSMHVKLKISCPKHGEFEQTPSSHIQGSGCPTCGFSGYQISKQEQDYADYLIELLGSEKVEQSNRTILNGKELDIYLPNHKLAIEYNGLYWHSSGKMEDDMVKRKQHLEKTELCAKQGIELLHINEGDNVDLWKQVIKNKLSLNKRIYARKTSIRLISNAESNAFLEHNHLQGKCAASIRYGLYYKNKLLSVMTFSKARYSDADWELIRFCTKGGYTVVGGASKLLKMFKTHHEGVIISYANKRWSNGNLYEKLGFTFLHDSEPCYWYIKDNKLWHRSRFMKHKLKKELADFDPKLSEVENMYNNKFRRIWDCGNKVYKL